MKVAFDLEVNNIDIMVTSGSNTITNSLTPDEAILFSQMIRSMAETLIANTNPSPIGPLTRQSMGSELS